MKDKVAVATVSGRAYFNLVKELKERKIGFLSLVPGETVPAAVKVVITTEKEKIRIKHDCVLVFDETKDPAAVVSAAQRIIQGKEHYEKMTIGIDPGEVFGLAVISDGTVTETENCFGIHEVVRKIESILREADTATSVVVKIGNGVPVYKELIEALDSELPLQVKLEVVNEVGTDRPSRNGSHRRGLRDIASAIRISARIGRAYARDHGESRLSRESGKESPNFPG